MKINKNKTVGFLNLSSGAEGIASVVSYPYVLESVNEAYAILSGSAGAEISLDPFTVYSLLMVTLLLGIANLYVGYKNFFKSNLLDDSAKGKYFKRGMLLIVLISLAGIAFSAVLMGPLTTSINPTLDMINSLSQ